VAVFSTIKIDSYHLEASRQEIKRLKAILDKLELPHFVDDISFHNTFAELERIKTLHNTNVWKVEKDGSLSLTNRFGHSGRLAYRELCITSIIEFHFADLCSLNRDEGEFLADLLCKFESFNEGHMPNEIQKIVSSD
jgi:hypothetical protein